MAKKLCASLVVHAEPGGHVPQEGLVARNFFVGLTSPSFAPGGEVKPSTVAVWSRSALPAGDSLPFAVTAQGIGDCLEKNLARMCHERHASTISPVFSSFFAALRSWHLSSFVVRPPLRHASPGGDYISMETVVLEYGGYIPLRSSSK